MTTLYVAECTDHLYAVTGQTCQIDPAHAEVVERNCRGWPADTYVIAYDADGYRIASGFVASDDL